VNSFIKKTESLLLPIAELRTPQGTLPISIVHQWAHALANDTDLFGDLNGLLRKELVSILKKNNLYKSKSSFSQSFYSGRNDAISLDRKFTFIDLFAGIGGMRLGAELNGGTCVFSSEFDKFSQETYLINHKELPLGDITNIEANLIPDHDLLMAGFPCQPFSYAGKSAGFEDQTRGTLFFDVLRIIEAKKPKVVLLENVKGFKSHQGGKTMQIAINALIEAGYNPKWEILNSYDFGVPQYRERWYCVATRNENTFEFPSGNKRGSTLRDIVETKNNDNGLKLSKFEVERIEYHFSNIKDGRVEHDSSKYEAHTKKGRHGVYSFQKADGALRFHIGDAAKTQIQEAFYACLDTYAPTIIANRTPKLWDIKRKLSVRESLRLQGFPESFNFSVSNAQAYKQLGNSVTVPVIQALIKSALNLIR
jgi:DNA (cytosine-5)-methyltransferase 1